MGVGVEVGDGEGDGVGDGVAVRVEGGVVNVADTGVPVGRRVGIAVDVSLGGGVAVGGWAVDVGDCAVAVGWVRVGVEGETIAHAVRMRSAKAAVR